jgi:hypothetical protein
VVRRKSCGAALTAGLWKEVLQDFTTVDEIKLHSAIMRALNQFNEEDRSTYMA